MKVGDLVKPTLTCSGQPGDRRCDIAIVVNRAEELNQAVKILCNCGSSEQYERYLEVVNATA